MVAAESLPIVHRLDALCGSDLNFESTRAMLESLSPAARLRELNTVMDQCLSGEQQGTFRHTLLHTVVKGKAIETVRLLLDSGAYTSEVDSVTSPLLRMPQ